MSIWKQLALCLVIAALAAGGWYAWRNPSAVEPVRAALSAVLPASQGGDGGAPAPRSGPPAGRTGQAGGSGPLPVVVAPAESDNQGERVVALGSAKAGRSVTLLPEVTGIVERVAFRPGGMVAEGDVLFELEKSSQVIAVERARIELEQARSALSRAQQLSKSKSISEVAKQDAEIAERVAEIALRSAELDESRRTIKAPFSGVTGLTDIAVGDLVTTSTSLVTVDDLDKVIVAFEVPERFAGRVGHDMPVRAIAHALQGRAFTGTVTAVDSRIDQTSRTLKMEATLDNPGGEIKPGMAVSIEIDLPAEERVAVPSLAVQWDRQGSFVWRVGADSKVTRIPVTILDRRTGTVVVKADIASGDTLVVEGVQRLRGGAEVQITRRKPSGAPAAEESDATARSGGTAPERVTIQKAKS
ncbi:efflux RND transporter periplasmic adaptor subunit [Propylenella binzhouense]|uniref:Efflux RND transporter periplasmic adaptor subunit n=1 Tax=Propylenella binzhouense TaxID=2555902 RepID=A0A964T8I7_9HYPH|nr:efflux RND transporter periplasmic adaptor subunit [Propylenella binzhouense]MYZ49724.1 efflux RND transporter periplasmic adaptor subunit [Propylenella binzhouense]